MIRGRASYGTFIGALSLAAVVASLYLSPLGTSPTHKKVAAASESRVGSTSREAAEPAAAKRAHQQNTHTSKGAGQVR